MSLYHEGWRRQTLRRERRRTIHCVDLRTSRTPKFWRRIWVYLSTASARAHRCSSQTSFVYSSSGQARPLNKNYSSSKGINGSLHVSTRFALNSSLYPHKSGTLGLSRAHAWGSVVDSRFFLRSMNTTKDTLFHGPGSQWFKAVETTIRALQAPGSGADYLRYGLSGLKDLTLIDL